MLTIALRFQPRGRLGGVFRTFPHLQVFAIWDRWAIAESDQVVDFLARSGKATSRDIKRRKPGVGQKRQRDI
jgi:hypothetical protein